MRARQIKPSHGGDASEENASRGARQVAPSPTLQRKSDVSDFLRLLERPNSGKPEFGCKRGREHTELVARADALPDHRPSASLPPDGSIVDGGRPSFYDPVPCIRRVIPGMEPACRHDHASATRR
jgi:hypothetical protein